MIHLSVWSHIRRLVVSAMVFGTAVLFMLWLPIRVIKYVLPGFLPYAVAVHTDAPVNELSLELLLLQVRYMSYTSLCTQLNVHKILTFVRREINNVYFNIIY